MKIGETLKKIRLNKCMTARSLSRDILTPQQMSNIERGEQMLATDKFILLLNKLNVTYDEFLFLLNDRYLLSKYQLEKELAVCIKRCNTDRLQKLLTKSENLSKKYDDVFFQHTAIIIRAMIELFQSNYDYERARKHLTPLRDYLVEVDAFSHYEIKLIGQCLFMFNIEEAIIFGERAVDTIKRYHSFHKNNNDACVVLINMAIYTLDYEQYYHLSLEYSQKSINLAATSNDATKSLNAQIINQIAHFKLGDGLFDQQRIVSLVEFLKLLNWHKEYEHTVKFIEKHGISLTST